MTTATVHRPAPRLSVWRDVVLPLLISIGIGSATLSPPCDAPSAPSSPPVSSHP